MNPILTSALGSILRWLLMILAAFLVKHGIWTDSEAGQYVEAGIVALLTLGWSLWQKYSSRIKFLTALMPGPTTENQVDAHIAAGQTPPLMSPTNAVPQPKPTP